MVQASVITPKWSAAWPRLERQRDAMGEFDDAI
jgi:hypothetical protein